MHPPLTPPSETCQRMRESRNGGATSQAARCNDMRRSQRTNEFGDAAIELRGDLAKGSVPRLVLAGGQLMDMRDRKTKEFG